MTTAIYLSVDDFAQVESTRTTINKIKQNFVSKDYIIFTDFIYANIGNDYPILSTFYMKFFMGELFFLNEKELEQHKNNTLAKCAIYKE